MFTDVVVGMDGTDAARDALAVAQTLTPGSTHLALTHVRVLDPHTPPGGNSARQTPTREASTQLLSAERERSASAAEILIVLAADVASGLHDVAESRGADLLVVGSSRRAAPGRVLVGDDAWAVFQGAPCAVAVAPRDYRNRVKAVEVIGVADDGSAQGDMALARARELSQKTGAKVVAHHVAEGNVVVGSSGEQLAAFSETVDVLICASRDNGIVRRVTLGRTSDYLTRHCACPLIITTAAVQAPVRSITSDHLAVA